MKRNTTAIIKAHAGKLTTNINELYTLSLISFGVPALCYIWFDWKLAVTVFVLIQIFLGIIRERAN